MGGSRGRKITEGDKTKAVELISQANNDGCRLKVACNDLLINLKTYLRWKRNIHDNRYGPKTSPANKLSDSVKAEIITISASKEYCEDSPWTIVPKLADKGIYIASESSFYKVLKEHKLLKHRGKSK